MTTKVVIGRFQPFHLAHYQLLKHAFDTSDELIVVIGSADQSRVGKNPWTWEERLEMIRLDMGGNAISFMTFLEAKDHPGRDDVWANDVRGSVLRTLNYDTSKTKDKVILVGCDRGNERYLDLFSPTWDVEKIKAGEKADPEVSGTKVRDLFFGGIKLWEELVSERVVGYLTAWKQYRPDSYKLVADSLEMQRRNYK